MFLCSRPRRKKIAISVSLEKPNLKLNITKYGLLQSLVQPKQMTYEHIQDVDGRDALILLKSFRLLRQKLKLVLQKDEEVTVVVVIP